MNTGKYNYKYYMYFLLMIQYLIRADDCCMQNKSLTGSFFTLLPLCNPVTQFTGHHINSKCCLKGPLILRQKVSL